MNADCRILLLDDEPLILMDLEFAAEDKDCLPLTETNVREAMEHIEAQGGVSCAVLDVTLRDGETCIPVARELERRSSLPSPTQRCSGVRQKPRERASSLRRPSPRQRSLGWPWPSQTRC